MRNRLSKSLPTLEELTVNLKSKTFLKSREGEKKIKRVFLWWPTRFDDDPTYRWLEMADVVYEVQRVDRGGNYRFDWRWVWNKTRFAIDEDYCNLQFEGTKNDDLIGEAVSAFTDAKTVLIMEIVAMLAMAVDLKSGMFAFFLIKTLQIVSILIQAIFR